MNKTSKFDLTSLFFTRAEILEQFLSKYLEFGDNLLSIDVSQITLTQKVFQLLKKKSYAVEICYKDLIYGANQKLSFVNFFKVFDS